MVIWSFLLEIIICDEIGIKGDIEFFMMVFNFGVNIIMIIYGFIIEDLYKCWVFLDLLDNEIFERVIILSNRNGVGIIENVYLLKGGDMICLNWFLWLWYLL